MKGILNPFHQVTIKDEVWWDFSLANLANRGNSPNFNLPINYFYIVHYWLYSKFANFSSANLLQRQFTKLSSFTV